MSDKQGGFRDGRENVQSRHMIPDQAVIESSDQLENAKQLGSVPIPSSGGD